MGKEAYFSSQLAWTSFFSQYLKRAFPGRSAHQILILAVPPKYAMDALPPFYRSVMTAWFALERKFVDNEYVICGTRKSVITLEQLSASFVYDTLSHQHRKQHRCVEKVCELGSSSRLVKCLVVPSSLEFHKTCSGYFLADCAWYSSHRRSFAALWTAR